MSGTDFIPGPDGLFDDFLKTFHDAVTADPASFGLTAADVAALGTSFTAWTGAYAAHQAAQAAAHTAAVFKDKIRGQAEGLARGLTKKINGNTGVDNAVRAKAGLPSHDAVKTAIGAPTTRPVGRIEARGHLTLAVHYADESTPHVTAKPHGVHACEVRIHVGDPAPADETGYVFLAFITRSPYVDLHPVADAGKTAYYTLRWLSSKLEPGPWSDPVAGKIPV